MTGWEMLLVFFIADIFLLIGSVFSIRYMRRIHPGHIFNIWYAFWLTFIIFSGLIYYIVEHAQTISHTWLGGGSLLGKFVIGYQLSSLDLSEIEEVAIAAYAIIILPQVLSYISSSISGCGKRLVLVEWTMAATTWFAIKFFAVAAGILFAQAIAAFYAKPILSPANFPHKMLEVIMAMSLSFIIAGVLCYTYSFSFKRWLYKQREKLRKKPRLMRFLTYPTSYTDSADAEAAKKSRYAWLRARVRKMTAAVISEALANYPQYLPRRPSGSATPVGQATTRSPADLQPDRPA